MAKLNLINPYTLENFYSYEKNPWEQVENDLNILKESQDEAREYSPFQRSEFLFNLKNLLEKNLDNLASLITQEIGKTITESRNEVKRAITTVHTSSEEAKRIYGKIIPTEVFGSCPIKNAFIERRPYGTILAITPFNFPLNLALHKVAPALASGNVVYLKPNPQNYLSTKMLVELCFEAGVPRHFLKWGVPDDQDMNRLVSHPSVNLISFTGGLKTASIIVKNAGLKKLVFELGGNDPLIVLPSADIKSAVKTSIIHRFGSSGQRCNAAKRFYIHETVYDSFLSELISETKKLIVGDPSKDDTFVGPVYHSSAAEIIEKAIQSEKSSIVFGGERKNNLISPTILNSLSDDSIFYKEECFGPVIPLSKFNDSLNLIKKLNRDEFALQAGVFTQSLQDIELFKLKLNCGGVFFNEGPSFRLDHLPFGGTRHSGFGREGVSSAIEEFTYLRTLGISGL